MNRRRVAIPTLFRIGGWLAIVALVGLGLAVPVLASTATINGTDHGATVTVTDWRQVWAGDLSGTIDGNSVQFYCIDTGHTISIPSVDPYTNDGPTSAQITHILNNYFPFVTSASGQLSSLDQEAAAVQLAIWHFSDGIDLSKIEDATIGNRALAIAAAATSATSTPAPIVTTIKIVPASQTNPGGTPGTFTIEAFDSSSTRMSGVEIALTTNSGTLSTSSVTTTGGTETPVTLTQDSSLAATVTAKTTRHIPGGTIYVDEKDVIGGVQHQKLVIATPTSDTLTTTGGFKWTASPTITTVANPTTGIVGVTITAAGDTATFHNAYNPTGSVRFTLYSDNKCTVATSLTGSGTISNGVASFSGGFTPTATGTYYWVASYAGDANNAAFTTGCGETNELVIVSKASPTITTKTGGTVVLGSGVKLTDSATLAGGFSPTGTITFTLTNPSSAVKDTETVTVTGNGVYSPAGFLPDMAGTWYWVATYSGDTNNNKVASGATEEPLVVSKASPTITTTLSASTGVIGAAVHDSSVLTGVTANAGGTVTYTVYTNDTCTLGAQDAGTKTVASGVVPDSNPITFNTAGTWYWQAVYSGDANNNGATSTCTSETLVISPTAAPTQSVEAATSAPTAAPTMLVEAATSAPKATPPVTSTGGASGGGSGSPLFALLVALVFCGFALLGIDAKSRNNRR